MSPRLLEPSDGSDGTRQLNSPEIPDTQDQPVAHLEVTEHGQNCSKTVPLYLHTRLRYGRDPSVVRSGEKAFSRDHLEFYVVHFDAGTLPLCYVRDRQSTNGLVVNGQHIGSSHRLTPGHLLQDGDKIEVPGKSRKQDPRNYEPCLTFHFRQNPLEAFQKTSIQSLEAQEFSDEVILTDRIIGEGAHARIHLAIDIRSGRKKQIVCKFMDINALRRHQDPEKTLRRWRQEIDTLRQLHHPNIASYVHAIESPHTLYCFTELASGGDLFSFISHRQTYVVNGVAYLHEHGVVHRDLKPENVLFAIRPAPEYRVVISDFGHSGLTRQRLTSMVGTHQYMSPEMSKNIQEHERPVDIWGVGTIMMFIINSEDMSNLTEDLYNLSQEVLSDLVEQVSSRSCMTVSLLARRLVRSCVQVDHRSRITAQQAKKHPWFAEARHKRRMGILRRSIELSWNANRNVFPATERLRDFDEVASGRDRGKPSRHNFSSTAAGSMMASQYFGTVNFGRSGHMPTPPRPYTVTSENFPAIRVGDSSSVEVPETPPEDRGAEHPAPDLRRLKRAPSSMMGSIRGAFASGESRHLELPGVLKKRKFC